MRRGGIFEMRCRKVIRKVLKGENMKPFDVSHLASKRACNKAAEMCEEIKAVVYKHSEEMPLALALGVLKIVESELLQEHEE